ncbi:ankyrin repeat domain-containing protein [Candidatus Cardinium hertigii]|uniref:ankyrin repeat domain-containing protein n=1 Tax=Candidatus Cardinium hertigii TaxID=247481 RepID=UPI003D7ED334
MNQDRAEKGLLKKFPKRPTAGNMRRSYNRNPKKMICGAIGAVALFGSGATAYSLSRIFSEGSNISDFNSTNFTTISSYQFESSTIGLFNSTGWNGSASTSTGSTLAYSAYAPSSTTVRNGNITNERDNYDNTPFIHAVQEKDIKVCTLLLNRPDIDVNEQNNYGDTAIHIAAYFCDLPIIKLLVTNKKVDLRIKNKKGITALDIAKSYFGPKSECATVIEKAMQQNKT